MAVRNDALAERLGDTRFYVRRSRIMARACILLAIVLVALNIFNLTLALTPEDPLYFATGPGKPPVALQPLSKPLPSTDAAMAYAERVVRFAFEGPGDALMDQQRTVRGAFLSRDEAERYQQRVVDGALASMVEGVEYLHLEMDRPPRLISEGIEGGLYTWVVDMRVILRPGPVPAKDENGEPVAVPPEQLGPPLARWRISLGLAETLRQRGETLVQRQGIVRLVIPELAQGQEEGESSPGSGGTEEIAPL